MRNKIVDMYQSGKGYKAISKALGLQRTTVRAIIHKWWKLGTVVNLPRSGRPTKIIPRAQWRLIQEVIKEPRTTSKELQASLAAIKVSVHDSTIRKRLGKNRHPWESSKAKAIADQKEHKVSSHICQKYLDYPQDFWANILWTDETKVELFGRCVSRYHYIGHQFVTSSSSALGLCSRTMIPNTPASPPLNGVAKSKSGLKSNWDAVAWP